MADTDWFYLFFFPVGDDPPAFMRTIRQLQDAGTFPTVTDLQWPVVAALAITALRFALESFVLAPLAHSSFARLPRVRRAPPPPTPDFETVYRTERPVGEASAKRLATDGRTVDDVYQWLAKRKAQDRDALKLKKFCEAGWRLVAYSALVVYGLWLHLVHTDWVWDTRKCWEGYPFQEMGLLKYYYFAQLGLYFHLLVSQFFDIQRKDFWEMFIHHIATIGLILFSYLTNFVRIGGLVVLVHDLSDIFLESAKLFNYAKWQNTCDALFVGFAVTFFVMRLFVFPFHVFRSAFFESWEIVGPFRSWWFFNGLLFVLQLLHLYWGQIIAVMAHSALVKGKVDKDSRSDSDSETDEDTKAN